MGACNSGSSSSSSSRSRSRMTSEVTNQIRARLGLTRRPSDQTSLELGLACSLTKKDELVEFMLTKDASREARASSGTVSPSEWTALFLGARHTNVQQAAKVAALPAFLEFVPKMEACLQHTLKESEQSRNWKQPVVKLLVFLALNAKHGAEEKVSCVIGHLVRADARRLEDVRTEWEEDGPNAMLLAQSIEAVVRTLI